MSMTPAVVANVTQRMSEWWGVAPTELGNAPLSDVLQITVLLGSLLQSQEAERIFLKTNRPSLDGASYMDLLRWGRSAEVLSDVQRECFGP